MSNPKGNCVVITNAAGEYLMQFRDDTPGINHPLMWEFFGGSADGDETSLESTVRELKEELNIDVQPEELEELGKHEMRGVDEYIYKLKRTVEWGDFVVNEGAGAAFLTKEELRKVPIAERVRFYLSHYL